MEERGKTETKKHHAARGMLLFNYKVQMTIRTARRLHLLDAVRVVVDARRHLGDRLGIRGMHVLGDEAATVLNGANRRRVLVEDVDLFEGEAFRL